MVVARGRRRVDCPLALQPSGPVQAPTSQAPDPVTFLPVHVRHDSPDERPPLELVLASGRCLRIPPGFDPAALRALLDLLEGPPC